MKTSYLKIMQLAFILFTVSSITTLLQAQSDPDYITVSGVVKDKKSKKSLEYATISISGTNVGTITNTEGGFSIKIKDSLQVKALEISRMGYFKQYYPIRGGGERDITIYLTPNDNKLKEIVVRPTEPLQLVIDAIAKIGSNYSPNPSLLTGFYRETIKKRRNYINISEAVIEMYKTSYTNDVSRDRVQVYKGRKLLSPKISDTLIVKFIGGPNLSTYLDIVKNTDFILDVNTLSNYKFTMEGYAMMDERPHYVIDFEPQVISPDALFYGKLYIDKESLAFSRAEFSLSMDDRNKATRYILRKKPYNMHFKPEEVSFIVTYQQQNGRSYLNYICNEVRFKCDWKKRLFSTSYTIVSEMVVTDRKLENVTNIPYKLAFNEKYSLTDKVNSFYDPNFWEDYNIIEPTESLESAINKLKKR